MNRAFGLWSGVVLARVTEAVGARRWLPVVICFVAIGALRAWGEAGAATQPVQRFLASVTFQVLPPLAEPGQVGAAPAGPWNHEEINRFIGKQISYIRSDAVLGRAVKSDEVARDPADPTGKTTSQWLKEHSNQPRKALLEELEIAQIPDTELFTIKLSTADRKEATRIVNAVARVYLDELQTDMKVSQAEHLEELKRGLRLQEEQVKRKEFAYTDYCAAHDVEPFTSRHETAASLLMLVKTDLHKAQLAAATASEKLASINQQVQAGTLRLSRELERYVESDPKLRMLEQAKLEMDLERAQLTSQAGAPAERVTALEARAVSVEKQVTSRREELQAAAKVRMQEEANAESKRTTAAAQNLSKKEETTDRDLREIAHWQSQAQARSDELKLESDILATLRRQYVIEMIKGTRDESRVRRLGGQLLAPAADGEM